MVSRWETQCLALIVGALASLALASQARATTFCVPSYHSACPDNGTNVATDLQTALNTNRNNAEPDEIVLADGLLNAPGGGIFGTFTLGPGADPLEILGAGSENTTLTNQATGNVFVMNLYPGAPYPSSLALEGFTFEVPDTLADDLGGAMQLPPGTVLEDVDIRNTHDGADGLIFVNMAGAYRDGEMYSVGTGVSLETGIRGQNQTAAQTIEVADSQITAVRPVDGSNLDFSQPTGGFEIDRSYLSGHLAAVFAPGVDVTATNSVLELRQGPDNQGSVAEVTLQAVPSGLEPGSTFIGDHLTFVGPTASNTGSSYKGLSATVQGGSSGAITATVTNSIFLNPDQEIERLAPVGADGDANITVGYSNIDPANVFDSGDGATAFQGGNINSDPLFVAPGVGNYHLQQGSPAIDAGDPNAVLPAIDLDGIVRPLDGDGDSVAVRDMGAYEFQPDEDVTITIQGKKVTLTASNQLEATLECPPAEASGPCEGKLKLATAKRVRFGGKKRNVTFGRQAFSIDAGLAETVAVDVSKKHAKLLRSSSAARALKATAKVNDQAGNLAKIVKKLGTKVQ
jgi:hypothetical protein